MQTSYSDDKGNKVFGEPLSKTGKVSYTFSGSNSAIYFGKNVLIKDTNFLLGDNCEIHIGDNCSIRGELRAVHKKSMITIGKNTKFNGACRVHAAEGKQISIGEDCLFSTVRFRTSDAHSIVDCDTNKRINPAKDISVGNKVWIAEDVKIYKGVTIGDGSIVGAQSTVTKSLPAKSLCVGSPAVAVKSNVTWNPKLL